MSASASECRISFAWLVVALLVPVALLNYLDRQMIAAMKASVVADVTGIDGETAWGIMLAQFKWCYAVFSPIGGLLADRFSRRWTICLSLFCWSIITLLTGTVTSYQGLLWTRTAMGISEAFYIPAALALIADYHSGPTRSRAIGFHQMGIYCGVILGGFAGYAADAPQLGWRFAFYVIGLIGAAYAIPLFAILRDPPTHTKIHESTNLASYEQLLTTPSFYFLVAYFTLPAMAGWVVRDWMPAILKESMSISQGKAGVTATLFFQIAAIAAAIVGGWLADRWSRRTQRGRIFVSAIGTSAIIPALLLVGFATSERSMPLAIGALILFGCGWGFFDCNNMPILCQIVKPKLRATGYGIMNMVSIGFGGVADFAFGKMKDEQVPIQTMFAVLALLSLIAVVLVLMIRPRYESDVST